MPAQKSPRQTPGTGRGSGKSPQRAGQPAPRLATAQDAEAVVQSLGGPPDGDGEQAVAGMQAGTEGAIPKAAVITFNGREFRIADRIPEMAIMKYAGAADRGISSGDMAGRAAMYALLRFAIWPGEPCNCAYADGEGDGDWHADECTRTQGDFERFEQHAMNTFASGDDLFGVIADVIEMQAARPTVPQSGSSVTGGGTSGTSKARVPSEAADLVSITDLAGR